jgi:phosphomannomutase/phosphoglucomutase
MNKEIFREYDIRGLVGVDLTEDIINKIGKAYATNMLSLGKTKVSVGYDCRLSSKSYSNALINGIQKTGLDVINLGTIPTPLLYFSIQHLKTDGGIMITGSHNPPEFNGLKICVGNDTIHSAEIQNLRKIIEDNKFIENKIPGKLTHYNIIDSYIDYVSNNIKIDKKIKVVVDGGNGTGGEVALKLFKKFNLDVIDLYCDMNGNFPNHFPDPTVPKNMEDLIKLVLAKKADLGIAFDGDADRLGVVSDKGEIVWGDQLMIIYSRDILKRIPGAVFISEVKCSEIMYDDIRQHGGRAIMWKTGHSLIKEKMKEENAQLAGEMSGHIFFKDRYLGFDDAIYSATRLIEIMSANSKKVSSLLEDLPKLFNTPEIRIDCPDNKKFDVVKKVLEHFKKTNDVIDIDGARVKFPDGWGLVRASNTQPVLVLRFEAKSLDKLQEIRTNIETVVKNLIG